MNDGIQRMGASAAQDCPTPDSRAPSGMTADLRAQPREGEGRPQVQEPVAIWVFAYGSLMWNPGFRAVAAVRARAEGFRRSFCMWSLHYRGTSTNPGLVLALEEAPGQACEGLALGVAAADAGGVLAYLRERELTASAYVEREIAVTLAQGGGAQALAYVIAPGHALHCAALPLDEQARIIARATGDRGANRDYLASTVAHLAEIGIEDDELCELARRVDRLAPG